MIKLKDFQENVYESLGKVVKCNRNTADKIVDVLFQELSKVRDDQVMIFINNRMQAARMKSTGVE